MMFLDWSPCCLTEVALCLPTHMEHSRARTTHIHTQNAHTTTRTQQHTHTHAHANAHIHSVHQRSYEAGHHLNGCGGAAACILRRLPLCTQLQLLQLPLLQVLQPEEGIRWSCYFHCRPCSSVRRYCSSGGCRAIEGTRVVFAPPNKPISRTHRIHSRICFPLIRRRTAATTITTITMRRRDATRPPPPLLLVAETV